MEAAHSTRARWFLLGAVFVASIVPFLPVLGHGFVAWDDELLFLQNDGWRGLSLANVRWMFTNVELGHYQPLVWLSVALEYELWNEVSPEGMHAVHLLLRQPPLVVVAGA